MSVNICRGREIAVTEPLLDLLHRNAICEHQVGARVPEIVKTNVPQSVGFQKLRKLLRHIVGLDKITNLIDADITCILFVLRLPAEPSVVTVIEHAPTFVEFLHPNDFQSQYAIHIHH